MRLVVCIDRDDDLGRKAQLAGPVVGRSAALEAATRLGVADPEDSDTNAILAGVQLVDELRGEGDEAEICILTGAAKVGPISDRRIARQLDEVVQRLAVTSAHLVSDGAEDEFIFPLISSRLKIDGVRRVYVRQNANIESTYYTVVRALKDPKLRAKTILPVAIVLLLLGITAAGGVLLWGLVALSILLGIYLVFWTFDIDEMIIDAVRSASTDVRQGSIAFGFGLFSVALVGVGFLTGYNGYLTSIRSASLFISVITFLVNGLFWWILGGVVWEAGRALRRFLWNRRFPRSWVVATASIVGIGFVSYSVLFIAKYLDSVQTGYTLPLLLIFLVSGFGLFIGASFLQQRFRAGRGSPASDPASS